MSNLNKDQVIMHQPLCEKEIVRENPVQVVHQHHVQPVVHETEHRIQPIIRTETTTENPVIEKDKNVLMAPIVDKAPLPADLAPVSSADTQGNVTHKPIVERDVVVKHPVVIKHEHHVQPIVHETVHQIQPIIKTEAISEQPIINRDSNVLMAPILDKAPLPAGLSEVESTDKKGNVLHKPIVDKKIVLEQPVHVRHEKHVQPIEHVTIHQIQPIIKTENSIERPVSSTSKEVRMSPIVEAPRLPSDLEPVTRHTGDGNVMHEAKVEREVIVEHPVIIKHEKHVMPVVHETVHQIQPVIKTEVTSETKHINTETKLMLAPIIEETKDLSLDGLEAVDRVAGDNVLHRPKIEREVIRENPTQIKHEKHIQPIIHETVHRVQPIVKTEISTERPITDTEKTVLLPPIIEPTVFVKGPAINALSSSRASHH